MDNEPKLLVVRHGDELARTRAFSYCEDDLRNMRQFTMGQAFLAVAEHYDKTPADYPRWISFSRHRGEYDAINLILQKLETDLEVIHHVCEWLGEEPF